MAAFLVSSPSSMAYSRRRSDGGGLSMENVAEEVLDVMFCHYEPPTSERAQLRAAQEARRDPAKYAYRKATKPILRPSSTRRKSAPGGGDSTSLSKLARTATSPGSVKSNVSKSAVTKKSVTWRDEQNKRNRVEQNIVGCAADYCGFFKQGEGIADILMSPTNNDDKNGEGATGPPIPGLKSYTDSNTTSAGASGSFQPSIKTTGTMTSTTSAGTSSQMNSSESPASTTLKSEGSTSIATNGNNSTSERVLYDDLGNPIPAGGAIDDLEAESTNMPPTPTSTTIIGQVGTVSKDTNEGITTNTASTTDPFTTFFAAPFAAAAYMMGANPPTTSAPSSNVPSSSVSNDDVSPATPSSIHGSTTASAVAKPDQPRTGVVAEYYEDHLGVYEPDDYDHPASYRQQRLPYRAVRAPTPLKRIPTPRFSHGQDMVSSQYDDEYYNNDGDYIDVEEEPDMVMEEEDTNVHEDGEVIQELRRIPPRRFSNRSSQPTRSLDEEPGRSSLEKGTMNVRIPGPNTSTPRSTFPNTRSDVYSDLTDDEGIYLQKRGATPVEADNEFLYFYDDRGNLLARRRPQSVRGNNNKINKKGHSKATSLQNTSRFTKEEEAKIFYGTPVASKSSNNAVEDARQQGKNTSSDQDEKEQFSPRQYAERLAKDRRRSRVDEKDIDDEKETSRYSATEHEQDLSPRQYAETLGRQRMKANTNGEEEVHDGLDSRFNGLRVATKKETEQHGISHVELEGARDPTPRNSLLPNELDLTGAIEELPPTPRREQDEITEERDPSINRTRRSLLANHFSPTSMATDDEIREEVSSAGMMTPSTIRPVQAYPNPFLVSDDIPERVDDEIGGPVVDRELTTSRSTLSSNPSKDKGVIKVETVYRKSRHSETFNGKSSGQHSRSSSKSSGQHSRSQNSQPHVVQSKSSSSSSRSKKLWKGWRKTVGKVKQIVNDIEEERLPLPPALRVSLERQQAETSGR